MPNDLLSGLSGALVGAILGLVGGGGSVLAVPLLVYGVGVSSTHVAIGTSALAVAASALANLMGHWRAGTVKWRCGLTFAAAGVVGAFAGSMAAKAVDGAQLLALFGALMIMVGIAMFLKRKAEGDPAVRLNRASARHLLPALIAGGLGVGLLSGFFGIGGGFLIVPALMVATGMSLPFAIGTSLIAVTAFGAATATSYAMSGLIDWRIAGIFVLGGVLGGMGGGALGRLLAGRKGALGTVLAGVIVVVGLYVVARSIGATVD
ncbi:sulfite exporter TauE/SafE family protein [Phreatobacter oligotrophus]|jgi:uncharacterized membrane protein YfcA|uniref:Probable membrane transporter protein n=1 Tax=Phreatobacter oligotrophus TaxID=1122261 RepID=A0A2T4Z5Z0_9HYPH|nr:sulfite exporter TauE/SafE family protein [Phreatobacter oligotrophus]PTM57293.1 hypothetical protein C8P69_104344 [Phreatobacter oligotrophus]